MPSTYRAQLRSALFTGVDGWRDTFNATQEDGNNRIRQGYRARPASFHPPLFYIGPITETLVHSSGVRQRDQRAQVILVRGIYENAETMDWLDEAADSLLDYLTATPHLVSGLTVITPMSTDDSELDLGGGTIYAAVAVTLRHDVAEGRV